VVGGEVSAVLATRIEDDPESTEDRHARLRVSAMGALKWVSGYVSSQENLLQLRSNCSTKDAQPNRVNYRPLNSLLSSPEFWTVLHHATHLHFARQDLRSETDEEPPPVSQTTEGFGAGQTIVRRVHGVSCKRW